MAQMKCTCSFKEDMITEMKNLRKRRPGKDTEWVNLLFPKEHAADNSLCCLLTCLFYYGYCEDCKTSLSEMARSVLAPLMEKQETIVQ